MPSMYAELYMGVFSNSIWMPFCLQVRWRTLNTLSPS